MQPDERERQIGYENLKAHDRTWLASRTAWWLAMGAITLTAALVRLHRSGAESIWLDEASTWADIQGSLGDFAGALVGREVQPPLYFLLMKGWTELVGDSEAALRFPSALAGTLTVPVLGWLSQRFVGTAPALVGTVLLTLSPFHIWHSQDARPYALFAFLILLSTTALALAWETTRFRAWLAYSVFLVAAFYTHSQPRAGLSPPNPSSSAGLGGRRNVSNPIIRAADRSSVRPCDWSTHKPAESNRIFRSARHANLGRVPSRTSPAG